MLCETLVEQLTPVTQATRDQMRASAANNTGSDPCDLHQNWMADTPCMHQLEQGAATGTDDLLNSHVRVAAWNMERCLDPSGSARLLQSHRPDVILLSEMDAGMARSGQRHTTQALAQQLGMHYLYGVEFVELELGCDTERQLASDDFNALGWHGNAILSRVPFTRAAMLRLDDHGHWFAGKSVGGVFGQPRVGGRMAILAEIATESGPVTFVSTHLESDAGADSAGVRNSQLLSLIDIAEHFADCNTRGNLSPIIIGGDLNTGNNLPDGLDWQAETLFASAEARGYHWQANPPGMTTRPSRITLENAAPKKLDWFCARDVQADNGQIIAALDSSGIPLSDHELIVADWQL